MTSICSSCGTPILPGTGRYITAEGVYCSRCGLPLPLGPNVKVNVTILDPERLTTNTRREQP